MHVQTYIRIISFSAQHAVAVVGLAVVGAALTGCGGGGGNSLTGGSIPTGSRASVTGTALLPGSVPASGASVTVKTLPGGTVVARTTTNTLGQFTVDGISASADLDVIVVTSNASTLESIVSHNSFNGGGFPFNMGDVTAQTSIVSAALRLEQANAPEDEDSILSNQGALLNSQVASQNYTLSVQQQLVGNPNNMNAEALTLISPVANAALSQFYAQPTSDNASAALNSVLGYLRAAHGRDFHITTALRTALASAELASTTYTPATIAAELKSAGQNQVTEVSVSAASVRERQLLPALAQSASSISPYEALIIAADVSANGGFQCNQNQINTFLTKLLGP